MESSIDNDSEATVKKAEYEFCRHIKQHYYNSYILNMNSNTLNFDDKTKSKKSNIPNFYDLKNSMNINKTLSSYQVHNFLDKFFIKNLSFNWMLLYNPQNVSINSINRDGCIFTITFDETGEILASSNHMHDIEIWDVKEKKVKKVIKDHKEIVTGLEFFNNSNAYNKTSYNKNNVKSLFQDTISQDKSFNDKDDNINNNDNSEDRIEIESPNDMDDKINSEEAFNKDFEFNSNNNYMMSCSLDKTIKLWKNYNCIHTFLDHNDWVRCLAISNDNNYFLSGCVSSVIKYWDLNKQKVLHSFNNTNDNPDLLNTVNSLHFMSNDSNVFMTGLRSGAVKIFDVRKPNKLVREFKAHKFKLNSVKFNKEDKYLLSSGRDSVARLWDFRNLPVIKFI